MLDTTSVDASHLRPAFSAWPVAETAEVGIVLVELSVVEQRDAAVLEADGSELPCLAPRFDSEERRWSATT